MWRRISRMRPSGSLATSLWCAGILAACGEADPVVLGVELPGGVELSGGGDPPGAAESERQPPPILPVAPSDMAFQEEGCRDGVLPAAASLRLLTRAQYDNTVRDLLGDPSRPARRFPAENQMLGFGNNATAHRASLLLTEAQMAAAGQLAADAVARDADALLPCAQGDRSESCMDAFVKDFGYRAFRRPLSDAEAQPMSELFRAAEREWGFDEALSLVIQAFLQAPQMLYRTETLAAEPIDGVVQLDAFQMASRLSYFLWNTMPDAELFRLAEQGLLSDVEAVRQQAERLLTDARARDTVADFHRQWLNLSAFAGLARPAEDSASVDTFNLAWEVSLERFVQHAFWEAGGDLRSLLTSPAVFVDENLATLYDLDFVPGQPALDERRSGLLTQPGMMALLAHPDQSAPVRRGKFVRERLLCQQLPDPPPTVDTSPPDPRPDATTRERFRQHSSDALCAECHRLLDGVGFGFENFDQLGRLRDSENGLPIDTSGQITDSGDPLLDGPFDGALELTSKLAESPRVQACMATQWFRYAMGRVEQPGDVCSLEAIENAFSQSGGDFHRLLVELATTDAFRFRSAGQQDH